MSIRNFKESVTSRVEGKELNTLMLTTQSAFSTLLQTQNPTAGNGAVHLYMLRLPASISTMKTISQKRPWSNQVSTGTLVKMFS